MARLSDKADLAVSCVNLPDATQVEGAQWETFQLRLLTNLTRFGIDVKGRQIGWSMTAALDAICDGLLHPGTPHTFISINQDEAMEKIRYANAILNAWHAPDGYPKRPKLIKNTSFIIEFENRSRLISFPCRPPRGLARNRIYLDEMAHYRTSLSKMIYTAALPATVKGDGYIRLGSSPLGAGGILWEIASQSMQRYPRYDGHRHFIPWWHVHALCKDVKTALREAPMMDTKERVLRFGALALVEVFDSMFIEDFMQEFECAWVDESVAWITWDVIKRNQDAFGDAVWFKSAGLADARALLGKLEVAIRAGQIEPVLVGGIDIGRVHDLTEFAILSKTTIGQLPYRGRVSLSNTEYDDQEDLIVQFIKALPFTQVLIDQNGIGAQLAENVGKRTRKGMGVDFTNPNKELWAVETRIMAERAMVPLPPDRDLAYQIHSIKKLVTAAKNNVFDAERNERGHADAYWAWALAVWAGKSRGWGRGAVV